MVAGSLLFTVVATAIVSSMLISSALSSDYMRAGKNIATVLAEQVRVYVLIGNPEGARRAVETVRLFPGMDQAAVYEFDGAVLSQFGGEQSWASFNAQRYLALAQTQLESETSKYWQFIAPVFSDSAEPMLEDLEAKQENKSLIGWVRIRIDKGPLFAARDKIIAGNIIVISIFFLVLLFALRRTGNFLTRPLEDFVSTMQGSAEGQHHRQRVQLSGSREMLQLSDSFNHMMQVLEQRDDELANARDQALDAARLKSEFAANVSHEIRTPLNGIVGTLDMLHRSGLNSQQLEYVSLAESASNALVELINDILDFSRLTLDQSSVNATAFNLHALLEELVALQSSASEASAIDLLLYYDTRLPLVLESDPNKLRQLLNNLLSNAIKFTDSGSVILRASMEAVDGDRIWVRISVLDSGIGIDEKDLKKIFLPYAQSDGSTTRKYRGTGLGLAISEKLADLLQGDIGVLSEPGKGSEFFISIPFRSTMRDALTQGGAQHWANNSSNAIKLCADTPELLSNLANVVELAGFQATALALPDTLRHTGEIKQNDAAQWLGNPESKQTVILFSQSSVRSNAALLEWLLNFARSGYASLIIIKPRSFSDAGIIPVGQGQQVTYLDRPIRLQYLREEIKQCFGERASSLLQAAQLESAQPGAAKFSNVRVLVVDDNDINLRIAVGMLRELGAEVSIANSGQQGQQVYAAGKFDIIFMDCRMPGTNGFDVTRWIRAQEAADEQVPIVAMTANFEPQDRMHCYESGMNDFLAKPVTLEQIADVLGRWVPQRTDMQRDA